MLSTARKRVEDDNTDERIYKAAGLPEPHESSRTVIVGLDKNVRNECISWNKGYYYYCLNEIFHFSICFCFSIF